MKAAGTESRLRSQTDADRVLYLLMRRQALCVRWRRISVACDELLNWRSLALWIRAIADIERTLPQSQEEEVRRRCPGLLELLVARTDDTSLWLAISDWAEKNVFADAGREGWIEALNYYCGKDARSEAIWKHWIRSESEWQARKPEVYPSFDEWRAACGAEMEWCETLAAGTSGSTVLDRYIECEAFALWIRATVYIERAIPAAVAAAIEKRCPGFLKCADVATEDGIRCLWRDLICWMEQHQFTTGDVAAIAAIRQAARSHLRSERIAAYWGECVARWEKGRPAAYPSFEQWLHEADEFVSLE